MKGTFFSSLALLATLATAGADIITQWTSNDTNAPATAPLPAGAVGTAGLLGGTTAVYVAVATSDQGGTNKAWSIKGCPAKDVGNKTAGLQLSVSTVGYHDIALSWYQENTALASRYARLYYSLDGATFIERDVIAIYKDTSYTNKIISLSAIPGATNNPLFGIRIVAEFECTATGSGAASYVATKDGSTYGSSGAIHYDLVTISGTPFPPTNLPPTISVLSNQTVRVNQSTPALPFTVLDDKTPAASLTLARVSSTPAVVPANNIVFGGSDSSCTVTATAASQAGSSLVP